MGTINYRLDVSDQIEITENIVEYNNYYEVFTRDGKEYYRNINEETYNNSSFRAIKDPRNNLELIINNNSEELIDYVRIYIVYYKDKNIISLDEYRGKLNIGQSSQIPLFLIETVLESKEVDDLHQRTKEGIETARLNNKQIGLPKAKNLVKMGQFPTNEN